MSTGDKICEHGIWSSICVKCSNMTTKQQYKFWRILFREGCLERDGHKCVFCDATDNLDVHHITDRHEMPSGGYVMSNGITVCAEHHLKCEAYHMVHFFHYIDNEYDENFSPSALYIKINSTFETAFNDSLNLK